MRSAPPAVFALPWKRPVECLASPLDYLAYDFQRFSDLIRGPGWSSPPMGFYIGILIKTSPPKGGVHKLMILLRDLPKVFLTKFFGEEMGGVRGTQTP